MGADIHSVVQVKIDNKWKTVACSLLDDHRNYGTFSMLADVRNRYNVEFLTVKGLPEDFEYNDADPNYITHQLGFTYTPSWFEKYGFGEKTEMWMGDHSHSWVTLDELNNWWNTYKDKLIDHEEKCYTYRDHGNIQQYIDELTKLALENNVDWENIRFVYGFDN